jgi:hypothetical protein
MGLHLENVLREGRRGWRVEEKVEGEWKGWRRGWTGSEGEGVEGREKVEVEWRGRALLPTYIGG